MYFCLLFTGIFVISQESKGIRIVQEMHELVGAHQGDAFLFENAADLLPVGKNDLDLLAFLKVSAQCVVVDLELFDAVLDFFAFSILRQTVPDVGPCILVTQNLGIDFFAVRQQRHRDD